MSLDRAVDRAVSECIEQGILRDFLLQNKAEVKHMSIFEYNEENVRRVLRKEAYEDGKEEGELKKLVFLVCKKMKMNQSLEKIAEDLVEEIPTIAPLYQAAKSLPRIMIRKQFLRKLSGKGIKIQNIFPAIFYSPLRLNIA